MQRSQQQFISLGIFFKSTQKQIWLQKRKTKDFLKDCWEFPGGKIEENESPHECIIRELAEEVGIKSCLSPALAGSLYKIYHYNYPQINLVFYNFLFQDFSEEVLNTLGQKGKWFTLSALLNNEIKLPAANIEMVRDIQRFFC